MSATVSFVGTATTVLRLGTFTLLTDPNFLHRGERVHLGYGLLSKRLTEPALELFEPAELDAVLLSHMHGDHFDRRARSELPRDLPVVTTQHAARRLRRWGFTEASPMDTWQQQSLSKGEEAVRITSVPAQHGPAGFHRLLPPVMGSVLEYFAPGSRPLTIYITGDTLNRAKLGEIKQRFPDIDAMLVHLGGTRIAGVLVTMDAAQGVKLMKRIDPSMTVPIHFDDYPVFRTPLDRFVKEVSANGLSGSVRTVERGETAELSNQTEDRSVP